MNNKKMNRIKFGKVDADVTSNDLTKLASGYWFEEFVKDNIGCELSKRMEEKGLAAKDLAKVIGTTTQVINRYLQGEVLPTVPVLIRMALALDCKVSDLIGW